MIRNGLGTDDKRFLVNLNVANRNFLMDIAKFFIATKIAYYSLVFALYGIFVSLTSIVLKDKMSLYELFLLYSDILLLISVPLSLLWWFCMKEEKKNINNARNFNKQYQKYFKELYPDSEEYI